jgi:hypothetical protein
MLRTKAPVARLALAILGASLLVAGNAFAQDDEGFDKAPEDTMASKEQTKEESSTGEKMPGEKEDKPVVEKESEVWNTREDPTKTYRYVGLRFRDTIVPKAILNIFLDGGATVNVPMVGLEFGTRRDNLELIFSLSYADYTKTAMLAKGKNEPDVAYELIESDLRLLYGKIEILYNVPLDSKSRWTIQIGGGVGIGGVLGDLKRNQVFPGQSGADPGNPQEWRKCLGQGNPGGGYCDNANEHFGDYSEPSWANGGSKPFIFPWIALPQLSVRYKPIKYLQARADVGFAITSGVYFGLGIGYIL